MALSCILGRRRRGGWYLVPVQSVGLSDSISHAFLSLPQQSRPVHPAARPHPGPIIDQIGYAIRLDPYDIEVERELFFVRAHLPPSHDPPPAPPGEEAMAVELGPDSLLAKDGDDIAYIEEMQRPYWSRMTIRDLRQRNVAGKVARQCHGNIGIYTVGSRLLVDVAVGDATAPSYLTLPSLPLPPPDELMDPQVDASATHRRPRKRRCHRDDADEDPSSPRLTGQSFAIKHQVHRSQSFAIVRIMRGWHSDGCFTSDTRFEVPGLLPYQTFAHAIC